MYSAKLSEPRRKRRRHGEDLQQQQTFPIPISSLTGIDANDDTWRWYEATLDRNSVIKVSDDDSIKMLSTMGFFGQVRNTGASVEKFVSVENFDLILNGSSDENVESCSVEKVDDKIETSSEESDVEVEEKKGKGWSNWKASADHEKEVLILDNFEAFFLAYGLGCLLVKNASSDDDLMSIDALWSHFCKSDANFRHRYAAYHHFRAKNWIVRVGTKFGNDFLLYKEGPPFYHASYSVRVQKNGSDPTNLTWSELSALNRVTESAAKELLIVEVDEKNSKIKEDCSPNEYLNNVSVKEVLARRWVASQKREDD